ncbi:MAG: DUF5711 family protein [Lachnospiraceae bacterium]
MSEIKLVSERAMRQNVVRKRILRGTIVVGILGAAVFGIYTYRANPHTYEVVWEKSIDLSEAGGIQAIDGNILVYDRNGAFCYDVKGNEVWTVTYQMSWPFVKQTGDYMIIADKKGREIVICHKTEGMTGIANTEKMITSADVSENGTAAVVVEDDTSSYIEYYSASGEKVDIEFKSLIQEDGYPLDIALSPSGIELMVSYISIDAGSLKNSILFYNFDMNKLKDDYVVGLFSHYSEYETFIPEVNFLTETQAVAFGDNRVSFYSLGDALMPKLLQEYPIEDEIQAVFYDENNVGIVVQTESLEKILFIYNQTGQEKGQLKLEDDFEDIFFNNGYVVLKNAVGCKIYTISGKVYYEKEFSGSLFALAPGGNYRQYYALAGTELQYIHLK